MSTARRSTASAIAGSLSTCIDLPVTTDFVSGSASPIGAAEYVRHSDNGFFMVDATHVGTQQFYYTLLWRAQKSGVTESSRRGSWNLTRRATIARQSAQDKSYRMQDIWRL